MSLVEVFTVPAKKLVRKAGSVLAGRSDVMTEDQAMDVLSKWRALHAYPINTLQAYLRGVLKRNKFAGAIVALRLKRTPSILEKLKRFENMSLDRMQDIGGLRVIVDNIADIYRLHQLMLNSTRFKHQLDLPPHDYIKSPKNDGYRSLHQVIRYQNESHEELNGLRLEIQIRTNAMNFWATAEHSLRYKYSGNIPQDLQDRLKNCAEAAFHLDQEMATIREEITNAQRLNEIKNNLVANILENIHNLYFVAKLDDMNEINKEFIRLWNGDDMEALREFNDKLNIMAEMYRV